MTASEWTTVRLYGTSWGDGDAEVTPTMRERTEDRRLATQKLLTDMLAAGWQMVSVVPQAPHGAVSVPRDNGRPHMFFKQEAWTVFLTRNREIS